MDAFLEEMKRMLEARKVSDAAAKFINELIKIADEFQVDRKGVVRKAEMALMLSIQTIDFDNYVISEMEEE